MLVVFALCCHKQVRQQLKGKKQYQTKIFEFVSYEHPRKNILLIGTKMNQSTNKQPIDEKVVLNQRGLWDEEHYIGEVAEGIDFAEPYLFNYSGVNLFEIYSYKPKYYLNNNEESP